MMKSEQEIREILEAHIAGYLLNKSELEFFESKKPSKEKDLIAQVTGQHGYGYRLSEWEEVARVPWHRLQLNKAYCFALANILGEYVHAFWSPEDYIERHKDELSPILVAEIEKRNLGAESHLRENRVIIDIPPSRH